MADLDFEMRLDRLFNEPPAFPDAEAFARLVELRLDRGWSVRQVSIGAAGMVGGLVGVYQLLGSSVLADAGIATERQTAVFTSRVGDLVKAGEGLSALPFGGEAIWLAAALGVMALAFAVTRAVEAFE